MRVLRYIFCAVLIFAGCEKLFAQPQSSLADFYAGLAFSQQHRTSLNDNLRTTNYYPLTADNYVWNSSNSVWGFTDTTLYVYTAAGKVDSETKKDNSNNFISRIVNSYDAADNLIDALHQFWSSAWVNNFRDTFAFDTYGNLTLQENHQWVTNQWVLAGGYRYFYTYNGAGKVLVKITLGWNTSALAWDTISRITNSYNGNDQVVQTTGESYNLSLNAWQLNSKRDYTYNASVNTQTVDYLWSGSQWNNNTQLINITWSTWTGDVNTSDPLNYVYQLWGGSSWNNFNRLTYSYNGFGGVIQLTELFVSGNWRNDSRLSEFYDNQYNYTGIRSESWNVLTASWDTAYEYKYNYTYDVNNAIIESIYQEYDIFSHVFVNYSRTVYSDFIFLDVNVPENFQARENGILIYPNPFADVAQVIIASENSLFYYTIYDSSGKLIKAGEERSNFQMRKEDFTEGLYLLVVSDGKETIHFSKFIVQ